MLRNLCLRAALVVALPIGLLAIIGAGSAQAASAVTFKGSISCSLTGTVTFSPELSNSNTTQATTATFKGKNKDCSGVDGTKLTQKGETLTKSKESFSFTLPANANGSCAGLVSGVAPAISSSTIKWKGTSAITPSTVSFPAGTINPSTGVIIYMGGTSTGSFAGSAQVALQATEISESPPGGTLPFSAANAATACAGPGIEDLTLAQPNPEPSPFSTNDNLEVGKAY